MPVIAHVTSQQHPGNPYIEGPPVNIEPVNSVFIDLRPRHAGFRIIEPTVINNEAIAWIYSIIYYLYFITINLLHLAITIASILVASSVFTEETGKWIVIGIAIVTAISLCLTDLMNGLEIQAKKEAFNGSVYSLPKWRRLFI